MESPNLNFLPVKTNLIETPFTNIDKYLDDKYAKELVEINKRISQMETEREKLKTSYETYYFLYTNSIKKAFEENKKELEICIPSTNSLWNDSVKIEINSMQRLAIENIKNELNDKAYHSTFVARYVGGQNDDDCRGCADYIGWMVFTVILG